MDYRNILEKIADFQIDKTRQIQNILEANLGADKTLLILQTDEQFTERVHLNLLELFFPQTLYVANLSIDKRRASPSSKNKRGRYGQSSPREVVQNALKLRELKFGVDWEYYQNQIVTFHDLGDDDLPLSQIVDKDTVTEFAPEEFYSIDDNQERVFKTMLGRCLQQKLYHQRVLWQNEDKLFIFADVDGEANRYEQWEGNRQSKRLVFERVMKDKKPDEILHCKHFAFRTQYKRFGRKWYLLIKPEWFFSFNGYQRSFYCSRNIDWLKKQENNSQVFNHLRFIVYFLKHDKQTEFFDNRRTYPFLLFGQLLSFDSALALDDNDWNPPRIEEEGDSGQMSIFDQ